MQSRMVTAGGQDKLYQYLQIPDCFIHRTTSLLRLTKSPLSLSACHRQPVFLSCSGLCEWNVTELTN